MVQFRPIILDKIVVRILIVRPIRILVIMARTMEAKDILRAAVKVIHRAAVKVIHRAVLDMCRAAVRDIHQAVLDMCRAAVRDIHQAGLDTYRAVLDIHLAGPDMVPDSDRDMALVAVLDTDQVMDRELAQAEVR
jgi:hypothetical protein